jgi:NAD(P) transhydrogenase subunit alpha
VIVICLTQLTTSALVASITVLVLAIFLGFELISKVPPTLHTPLMSGANAISGIIVAALMASNTQLSGGNKTLAGILACVALALATINCVGGFMVTGRMLEMFKRKEG